MFSLSWIPCENTIAWWETFKLWSRFWPISQHVYTLMTNRGWGCAVGWEVMLKERSVLLQEQRVPYDHMRKGHWGPAMVMAQYYHPSTVFFNTYLSNTLCWKRVVDIHVRNIGDKIAAISICQLWINHSHWSGMWHSQPGTHSLTRIDVNLRLDTSSYAQ